MEYMKFSKTNRSLLPVHISKLFLIFQFFVFFISASNGAVCKYPGQPTKGNPSIMDHHIFKDPSFWQHFQHEVQSKSWKCNFQPSLLQESLEKDASLYEDDRLLKKRRYAALNWVMNETLWINLILGTCKEIADGHMGTFSLQLKNLRMLEPLVDFVEHLNCFYTVATAMSLRGRPVKALSQDSSQVHDIDKLDPVMVVGYSERFTDNQVTSLWDDCVYRHTHVNPHHQAHWLWNQDCSCNSYCEDTKEKALSEMVCDKVSRRLQKDLNGTISDDMWNVDLSFFKGLPKMWLDRAQVLMEQMKLL